MAMKENYITYLKNKVISSSTVDKIKRIIYNISMKTPETKLNKDQLTWIQITSALTFKEMDILMNRYILGYTLKDIAQRYKVEMERVRQMENTALQKISLHSSLTKKSYVSRKNVRRKTGDI